VAKVTLIFGTSPNIKPEEKKWGTWHIITSQPEKVGGHFPRVPHKIAPMLHCKI